MVADLGVHDAYAEAKGVLTDAARRLAGLPVLFVGVHCPLEIIMQRRNASGDGRHYVTGPADAPPPVVRLWSRAVHTPGVYDLEVDTGTLTPLDCAQAIRRRLDAADDRAQRLSAAGGGSPRLEQSGNFI